MATPEHTPIGRGYESFVGYYTHANDFWNKGMGKIEDQEAFAIVGEVGVDYEIVFYFFFLSVIILSTG